MKKALVALLVLFIGTVACMSIAAQDIVIGLSLGTLQQERWTNEKGIMEKYVATLKNVKLLVQAADGRHRARSIGGACPDRDAGAEFARGGRSTCTLSRRRDATGRLRQGDRARHPQIHDRGDRGGRSGCAAGDPVGAEFCRGRGARPADRGHAGGS